MAYNRVNWQSGTKVSDGYVEIDGTQHPVVQPVYQGPTPINPASLNIMDAGIKENSDMLNGNVPISKIEIEDIKCKNILNSDSPDGIAIGATWTGTSAKHFFTANNTFSGGIHWFFSVKAGEKYTFSYKNRNSENVFVYIFERSSKSWTSSNITRQIVNDGTSTTYSFTIENDGYLSIAFQNSVVVTNITIENIQLEKGNAPSNYCNYKKFGYTLSELIQEIFNIPSDRLISTDNLDNLYKEVGIKVYSIWEDIPLGMPTGAYNYGTLVVITQSISAAFLNTQYYIPDDPPNSGGGSMRGIYVRSGNHHWMKITGASINKKTS